MVVRATGADIAYCQWFAGIDLHEGTFLFTSLEEINRLPRPAAVAPSTDAEAEVRA